MRVLHTLASVDPRAGGVAEAARLLVRGLQAEGVDSVVATLDPPGVVENYPCRLLALGPGRGKYGYSRRFLDGLRAAARDCDALVVHGIWQFHALAGRLAAEAAAVPLFVMPHGMLDPWDARSHPLKQIKKRLYWRLFERAGAVAARRILFTCDEERRIAQAAFLAGIDPGKLAVAGLGIEEPPPPPSALAARDGRHLLFLGRIDPKKALDVVIGGFARLAASHPQLRLTLAGPGDAAYLAGLRQLAERLGVAGRIAWPGMVRGDAKWSLLRQADLFVLPSHQENFGIAVVEALACATPVLISRQVNIWREIVASGGGLACDADVESFAAGLADWLDGGLGEAANAAARRCFTTHYTLPGVAARLADLLRA